jgi:hypothetical protein
MKKLSIVFLVLMLFLTACTPYMYGVPQETWDRMSETQRIEAMGVYEREQQARRQAAEERARQRAFEREQERARQAEVARARQERIEAIHRGEGAYGELLRVRLQGGRIRVGDRHHRYEPITFTIADGETREIGVADRKGRQVALVVTYSGGVLSFEGIRFPYDRSWGRGRVYPETGTSGPLELRGVDVFIEVHDRSSRHERELPRLVIIREEPPPPVVAPRERDHHRPPPPVTIREERPIPPPVVVREERPKPPPVVVREKDRPRPPDIIKEKERPTPVVVQEKEKSLPPPGVVREKEKPKPPPTPLPVPPAADRPPRTLEVVLLSGEMKVQGRNQNVERVTLRLAEGESRNLAVKAGNNTGNLSINYRNGELFIDGSPGRGRDAVRLPFEKEWKAGKVYRFDLKGKMHLEKVEMKVTGIEGK